MLMDAKTLIGPPVDTSGNYDGLLEDIIAGVLAAADEFMEAACQREEDAEVYFDGGEKTLYLPHFNVSNVSVYENGIIMSSDEYTLYPGTGISAAKIQRVDGKFRKGQQNIKAIYDGGYEEDDYPPALRRKLLKQVSYEFRRRNDPGLSSVSAPDGSVQKFDIGEWLKDVEAELERRRRIFL
jgi:hypothetical protein